MAKEKFFVTLCAVIPSFLPADSGKKRCTKNRKMNGASQRQLSKDVKEDLKKIHPSIPYAPLAI